MVIYFVCCSFAVLVRETRNVTSSIRIKKSDKQLNLLTHKLTPCQKPAFPTSLASSVSLRINDTTIYLLKPEVWESFFFYKVRVGGLGGGGFWGGRNHSWLLFSPCQQLYLSSHQVLLIPTPQVSHIWVHFSSCPFIHPFTHSQIIYGVLSICKVLF